jgi:hypothetical protein
MPSNFQNLIDPNKFQVFVFKSKANFPFIFAIHPWIVVNKKGEISRWEVAYSKNFKTDENWGYLYKNLFPPFQGLNIFPFIDKPVFKSELIGTIEGEKASTMITFIENMPTKYPYLNKYNLLGPNSNTFVNYVINKFPELNIKLPWNAFGKNYE